MVKKKKPKQRGVKLSAKKLQKSILKLFQENPKAKLTVRYIKDKLKIANNKDSIGYALEQLQEKGLLKARTKKTKFFVKTKTKEKIFDKKSNKNQGQLYEGKVDITRSGDAYIVCKELDDDIYVSGKKLKSAMNGDLVLVELLPSRGRRRPEGKVKRVLERSITHFLGKLRLRKKYAVLVPDSTKIPFDIYVELDDTKGADDNDIVVVKVTKWPARSGESPVGVVTSVLGGVGGNELEMNSILLSNGFNMDFPEEVIDESEALDLEIPKSEATLRRDMRQTTTFTIDPDTAKDFDDALSIEFLDNGDCEVGVHIADVTHYVKEGTALDKEAYLRSTSVYLVDRVAPMLPERLSNELCSLRPHEDKCTFSAVFVFSKNGKIKSRWFGKTLIHSDRRFTYEEAQEVLESGKGDFAKELKKLNQLAHVLRKEKFKNGAIAFESDEVKFDLDDEGYPLGLYVKERKDAHMLIEDFMLLANREVATFIVKKQVNEKEIPFVYRVHDLPNPDKLGDFVNFARSLEFELKTDTPRQIADSFNRLAEAAKANPILKMLEPLAIRTMSKAIYTSENIGHYGLGFDNYSHFTSPIRRYSDVLTHRILEKNLESKTYRMKKDRLEEMCVHISNQERKAMTAERESIKYKMVEYMEQFIGDEFEGFVSGIIDRGIFVELKETKAEGMVSFETMGEPYEVEEGRLKAIGKRSRSVIKMGDVVKVRIVDTDLDRRQIEMELVEE